MIHCFAQPRADSAFCLYCGAACVLHVVLPRQHPDGGECGGKSGAGHPGDGAGGQPQWCAHRGVRDRRKSLCEPHEGGHQRRGVHGFGVREFSGAVPRGGRAGREHGRFGSRHHGSDDFTGNGIICDFSQPKVQAGVDRAFEQKK